MFLVLDDRARLNEILQRIETKYVNKLIDFLKENHFLLNLSRNALTKFIISHAITQDKGYGLMMLLKTRTIRGQVIYREGEEAKKLYIVSRGNFQLQRKLPRVLKQGAQQVVDSLGGRKIAPEGYMNRREPRNVLAEKIPEIKDVPKELPLMVFGEGSFLGEEDVIFRDYYSCTLKCISQNGVLL